MSNRLQKDLANAKARLKAALNKLEKLESSDDNQAIAAAQSKVDLEREIIEDIEKRLQNETKNFTAIVRQEDGSLDEIAEDNAPRSRRNENVIYPRLAFVPMKSITND